MVFQVIFSCSYHLIYFLNQQSYSVLRSLVAKKVHICLLQVIKLCSDVVEPVCELNKFILSRLDVDSYVALSHV